MLHKHTEKKHFFLLFLIIFHIIYFFSWKIAPRRQRNRNVAKDFFIPSLISLCKHAKEFLLNMQQVFLCLLSSHLQLKPFRSDDFFIPPRQESRIIFFDEKKCWNARCIKIEHCRGSWELWNDWQKYGGWFFSYNFVSIVLFKLNIRASDVNWERHACIINFNYT